MDVVTHRHTIELGDEMETYLLKSITVDFDSLYLDPNNPRLAPEELPGYDNPKVVFAQGTQEALEASVHDAHDPNSLAEAIITQGWMPIDSIVVWQFPKANGKYVVLEGNRRTVALRDLRRRVLPREEKKLEGLRKKKTVAKKKPEPVAGE